MSYTDTTIPTTTTTDIRTKIEDLSNIFDFLILSIGELEDGEITCQDVYIRGITNTLELCRDKIEEIGTQL